MVYRRSSMSHRPRHLICLFCLLSGVLLFVKNAQAQALLPSREWTNADGKKLRAELLVFKKSRSKGWCDRG